MSPSKILKICRKLPFLCSFNTFHYYFHMGRVKRTFIEQLSTVLVIHVVLMCLSASLDYRPYWDRRYIPFYVHAQPSYCHTVCIQ